MRQSPLLSLCLGGLIGIIAACSSSDGLQPITRKKVTSPEGISGSSATGGETEDGGAGARAGSSPGGWGGLAGVRDDASGGILTIAGSSGDGDGAGTSGTWTSASGGGGASGTAGTETAGGTGGSSTSGGTAGAAGTTETGAFGGAAGANPSGGAAGLGTSGGTAGSGELGGAAGASGAAGTEANCRIEADADGWVASSTNDCGIQGYWYSYSDCTTSPGDCTANLVPEEGALFAPEGPRMCTSATTALVASTDELEAKWGVGIGLSLNQPPADSPREGIGGLPVHLVGFSFNVVGTPPPELRVNFPTPTTERIEHFATITSGAGPHEVHFSEAEQGYWVPEELQIPLNPDEITAIQFHVPTQVGEQVSFDYCIENLDGLYSL